MKKSRNSPRKKSPTKQTLDTKGQNHIKARYLSLFSQVVADSNPDQGIANACQKIGITKIELIATDLALQFLQRHHLNLTISSGEKESCGALSRHFEDRWLARQLQIRGRQDVLHGLIQRRINNQFHLGFGPNFTKRFKQEDDVSSVLEGNYPRKQIQARSVSLSKALLNTISALPSKKGRNMALEMKERRDAIINDPKIDSSVAPSKNDGLESASSKNSSKSSKSASSTQSKTSKSSKSTSKSSHSKSKSEKSSAKKSSSKNKSDVSDKSNKSESRSHSKSESRSEKPRSKTGSSSTSGQNDSSKKSKSSKSPQSEYSESNKNENGSQKSSSIKSTKSMPPNRRLSPDEIIIPQTQRDAISLGLDSMTISSSTTQSISQTQTTTSQNSSNISSSSNSSSKSHSKSNTGNSNKSSSRSSKRNNSMVKVSDPHQMNIMKQFSSNSNQTSSYTASRSRTYSYADYEEEEEDEDESSIKERGVEISRESSKSNSGSHKAKDDLPSPLATDTPSNLSPHTHTYEYSTLTEDVSGGQKTHEYVYTYETVPNDQNNSISHFYEYTYEYTSAIETSETTESKSRSLPSPIEHLNSQSQSQSHNQNVRQPQTQQQQIAPQQKRVQQQVQQQQRVPQQQRAQQQPAQQRPPVVYSRMVQQKQAVKRNASPVVQRNANIAKQAAVPSTNGKQPTRASKRSAKPKAQLFASEPIHAGNPEEELPIEIIRHDPEPIQVGFFIFHTVDVQPDLALQRLFKQSSNFQGRPGEIFASRAIDEVKESIASIRQSMATKPEPVHVQRTIVSPTPDASQWAKATFDNGEKNGKNELMLSSESNYFEGLSDVEALRPKAKFVRKSENAGVSSDFQIDPSTASEAISISNDELSSDSAAMKPIFSPKSLKQSTNETSLFQEIPQPFSSPRKSPKPSSPKKSQKSPTQSPKTSPKVSPKASPKPTSKNETFSVQERNVFQLNDSESDSVSSSSITSAVRPFYEIPQKVSYKTNLLTDTIDESASFSELFDRINTTHVASIAKKAPQNTNNKFTINRNNNRNDSLISGEYSYDINSNSFQGNTIENGEHLIAVEIIEAELPKRDEYRAVFTLKSLIPEELETDPCPSSKNPVFDTTFETNLGENVNSEEVIVGIYGRSGKEVAAVNIPVHGLKIGKPVDAWYQMRPSGKIHIVLSTRIGEPINEYSTVSEEN
ncbi:hypothetical protein TRFO_20178 [Tritrichomonas foetus]|uniref:Uncharacterized protein n=1 Tax=Tritrichomonas foetus TaxID=1144522 RepID=A0A1J4KH53_9EUKA|nr:hypothetical protein TRFO_20178 [Tritrichomonas foetus]|eukprot:OHT10507.1 hypothetical protein TRFO_20178 [Tritrichomonas foetus]